MAFTQWPSCLFLYSAISLFRFRKCITICKCKKGLKSHKTVYECAFNLEPQILLSEACKETLITTSYSNRNIEPQFVEKIKVTISPFFACNQRIDHNPKTNYISKHNADDISPLLSIWFIWNCIWCNYLLQIMIWYKRLLLVFHQCGWFSTLGICMIRWDHSLVKYN